MPFYESGKIVLNRNESECFRKQLKAPDLSLIHISEPTRP